MNNNFLSFTKKDLAEVDYVWYDKQTAITLTAPIEPSRRLFDRYDGNQILHMINYFAQTIQQCSVQQANMLERLLRNELPFGIKSELSVFRWLVSKFNDAVK